MSSVKWRPFCLGLNVFTYFGLASLYGDIVVKWPGYGLLTDGTKPLTELMLIDRNWGLLAFTETQFHVKY